MARSRKLGVICGGSGSSKFVTALSRYLQSYAVRPVFVGNVGDNFWHYGLYICPDVDILTYALAGKLDEKRGWGIANDSSNFLKSYSTLYPDEAWFNLGDSDLALCLRRTELMRQGWSLSKITEYFARLFHIEEEIIPASDDELQTFITTPQGKMHLQEFWVKNSGEPEVTGVEQRGSLTAEPNDGMLDAISDRVLILPANPVSSILPTINLAGVRDRLRQAKTVVAISPFVGSRAFSGPAAKFMRALGHEPSSFGVATIYSEFLKMFLVDTKEEESIIQKVQGLGIECMRANIRIQSQRDKERIVNEIAEIL